MKHFKLIVHRKILNENSDLLINSKDFPNLKINDIVEIYHPEDEFSRLLLQVTVFKDDLQGKDIVSVEQGIAQTFQLKAHNDIIVNKVEYRCVALDSVEVTFKDQYLGRSEMWRLKQHLVNTCVYLNKKIEFCGGSARVQVYEMWSQGEKMACGVITQETKIIFRSSTAMVYLFLQMSSEMWEFNVHGDLYFEKATIGFMADLFQKWKKHGSNHEVTIVLFSRILYKSNNIEDFPDYMRECLQKDYKGCFYEDFYRIAVQNEKYDDWYGTLTLLQNLFVEYRRSVLEFHKKLNYKIPQASLSTAARGNFLEVLNISLNVFERHYLERSLDRTGQLIVVISPGAGIFEVDRELANVTKQRIIDNGVGCDLVCVGEQPLHAVPLLKFHNKDPTIMRDDYSMPHWINLSFYSTDKKPAYSKFLSRIRLPPLRSKISNLCNDDIPMQKLKLPTDFKQELLLGGNDTINNVDYNNYDNQIFVLPSSHVTNVQKIFHKTKNMYINQEGKVVKWKLSDPDIYRSYLSSSFNNNFSIARSTSIAVPDASSIASMNIRNYVANTEYLLSEDEFCPSVQTMSSSDTSSASSVPHVTPTNSIQHNHSQNLSNIQACSSRALINPFDPSHITIKVTSNRRRWTHVFPKGPSGIVIQHHHYQSNFTENTNCDKKQLISSERKQDRSFHEEKSISSSPLLYEPQVRSKTYMNIGSPSNHVQLATKKSQTLLWGVTGEQKWTSALTTGMDWKSLVIPACLPITTDYFPDEVCLKTDYLFSDYNLLPDDVNADYARRRAIYREPLKTLDVFHELISQRLAQGFQLIVDSEPSFTSSHNVSSVISRGTSNNIGIEYKLSIGRIFHKISLCKSEIRITRYRPRHPYPPFSIHYRYCFQVPDHTTYRTSSSFFNAEILENFNWNYLDNYICTRGDTDFSLIESCKYWRFRMFALPFFQSGTKKILDGSKFCDVYTPCTQEEKQNLLEGFLKFMEYPVNKIKRNSVKKQTKVTNITHNSSFKERRGSINREKIIRPSVRSGSKILEKQKMSPVVDVTTVSLDDNELSDYSSEILRLKESATYEEIVEALCHPTYGVDFLSKYPSLPSNSFISYDAVQWCKKHIEGILFDEDACKLLEDLRKARLICHASGDMIHPFLFGFYLYYVPRKDEIKSLKEKEKLDHTEPIYDLVTFKNEWAEVETSFIPFDYSVSSTLIQNSLLSHSNTVSSEIWSVPMYKQMHLEVDMNNKSDKIEWGHARYQSVYNVDEAFELVIEWVVASGPIVSDLVYSLARKAQTYNLQLIPVPADPHAIPHALKSDPLREPIFIPLHVECLMNSEKYVFKEYFEENWTKELLSFQEEIAILFGFIRCKGSANMYHQHYEQHKDQEFRQYVHLTGNIFLLTIVSQLNDNFSNQNSSYQHPSTCIADLNLKKKCNEVTVNDPDEYIIKHFSHNEINHFKMGNQIGYLWSWNHMVGRRWKGLNPATNDEAFQDKLLLDFRRFCFNFESRLINFWEKIYLTEEK